MDCYYLIRVVRNIFGNNKHNKKWNNTEMRFKTNLK